MLFIESLPYSALTFVSGIAQIIENIYEYIKLQNFFNLLAFLTQLCFFLSFLFFFFQTEKGSALHEAALFGKVDVVRVLLETGNYHDSPWSLFC